MNDSLFKTSVLAGLFVNALAERMSGGIVSFQKVQFKTSYGDL